MKLYQNNMAYSIVDFREGGLMASNPTNISHDRMLSIICPAMTSEDVVGVIKYQDRWELKHDSDGFLRTKGIISQDEWLRRGKVAAQVLIDNGADPQAKATYDWKDGTLEEWANVSIQNQMLSMRIQVQNVNAETS